MGSYSVVVGSRVTLVPDARRLPGRLPPMLLLVMLIESAMPTANNLMMMCELAGKP